MQPPSNHKALPSDDGTILWPYHHTYSRLVAMEPDMLLRLPASINLANWMGGSEYEGSIRMQKGVGRN